MGFFIWGIIIADTVAAFMIQVGFILMRIALVNVEGQKKNCYLYLKWFFGFALSSISCTIHVALQAFMSVILLSATCVTSLVFGVILAIVWLKEQFVWQYDVAALTLMIGGCVSMVLQAGYIPDKFTFEELLEMVKSEKSIIFYTSTGVVLIFACVSYYWLLVALKKFEKAGEAYVIDQKLTLPPSLLPENINKTESTFNTRNSDR